MGNNIDYSVAKAYWEQKRKLHKNTGWGLMFIGACVFGFIVVISFRYFSTNHISTWFELIPPLFFISLGIYVLRLIVRLILLQMNIWADASGKITAIKTYELSYNNLTPQERLYILRLVHEPQSKMDLSSIENNFEILKLK